MPEIPEKLAAHPGRMMERPAYQKAKAAFSAA